MSLSQVTITKSRVQDLLTKGSRFIAPLWSLENFVAVNAYMGYADTPFPKALNFLSKSSSSKGTLPLSFYLEAFNEGKITVEDVQHVLASDERHKHTDVDEFLYSLGQSSSQGFQLRTLADVASQYNGKKWNRFMADRISFWASAYFDEKQASWDTAQQRSSLFTDWKREAEVDLGTEVMGLKGFRKFVSSLPENYLDAASLSLEMLEIPEEVSEAYLNSLLMRLNGWAGFTARIDWDARLRGEDTDNLQQFLSILLVWEVALKNLLDYPGLNEHWTEAKREAAAELAKTTFDSDLDDRLVMQYAFDRANQRTITEKINGQKELPKAKTPKFQSVFCIDVRSEVFRRNLEAINSEMETLGFAGFFAFPIKYVPLGYEEGSSQCPVLLSTSHTIKERWKELMKVKLSGAAADWRTSLRL